MLSSCSSVSGAEVVPESGESFRDAKDSTAPLYKAWHDGREARAGFGAGRSLLWDVFLAKVLPCQTLTQHLSPLRL